MNYILKDIYNSYQNECKNAVEKQVYVDVVQEFNIMIVEYLLEGKEFNMGNNLSTLSIVRRDRDPRSPRLDWGESNKYKKELLEEGKDLYNSDTNTGIKWHIYHTDEFYCKYYWRKVNAKFLINLCIDLTLREGLKETKKS